MSFIKLNDTFEKHLSEHPERAFIIKSLALIFLIITVKTVVGYAFLPLASFAYLNYLAYLWVTTNKGVWGVVKDNISFIDAPQTATQERSIGTAWATWTLIFINCFFFFFVQTDDNEAFIRNNIICTPAEPNLFNYPLSFLTSMYLHGGFTHLFGNMCFLWATGTVVERRIGWKRFLTAYHIAGLAGAALAVIVYSGILSEELHLLGASGAISGVMGVFIVRCYFKKMILPLPLFGFLPVNINIRLNAFAVIGMFFILDLRGGLRQLHGSTASTGYWAHLGGMAAGLWMAHRMQLTNSAIEERHREIGSNILDGKIIVTKAFDEAGGFGGAEKSLLIALDKDPDNPDTHVALARLHSHHLLREKGRWHYRQALRLLLWSNSTEITAVFREFFYKYRETLEAGPQYRIASLLYREGDHDLASRTLEMLVEHPDTPEPLREKCWFLAAKLLEKMELHEAAHGYYERFAERYPASQHVDYAQARLETLRGN